MNKKDFDYHLPKKLIAQQPIAQRSQSRLLVLDKNHGSVTDCQFTDIIDFLNPDDLLVFNNTKVMPARLPGRKQTGGQIEVFIERVLNQHQAKALLKSNKSVRLGTKIYFNDQAMLQVTGRQGMFFLVEALDISHDLNSIMEKHGVMPLPPYIQRDSTETDSERYQTVYAKTAGAVAAPTAGLHFDDKTLSRLKEQNINSAFVTLHVGAGTFQPVKVDIIENHKMHKEWLHVDDEVVKAVKKTKARGGRVIAVGTTAVRCLETACQNAELKAFSGDTDIFIYPGYRFKVIDGLLTNFHLPESTLLMLVSALAGRDNILNAYHHAIEQKYRFFSYGDAMLIVGNN